MFPYAVLSIFLVAFDAVSTAVLLDTGLVFEANPLWAAAIARVGAVTAMVARLLVGWGLVGLLLWADTEGSRLAAPALIATTFLLSVVAGWHAAHLTEVFA